MDGDDFAPQDHVELSAYRLERTQDMIHSELRSLYNYWNRLRAGRTTPMRSDIDPRDMECDARNLFILENLGRGNIRFRLAGTAIVDAFGMELRGMNARAIMSTSSRESFTALINEALEDPGAGYARLRDTNDKDQVWEINLLPLRSDFGMIDRVIGCLHPITSPKRSGRSTPLRFRIEQMSVDPINASVRDMNLPTPLSGFQEERANFEASPARTPKPTPMADAPAKPFTAIEGGRTKEKEDVEPTRTRGHLRLVKD
ncbi:MAG: PAS domain-containing protein [Pseudomonadota bacterium]